LLDQALGVEVVEVAAVEVAAVLSFYRQESFSTPLDTDMSKKKKTETNDQKILNEKFGLEVAIEEMQAAFERQLSSVDAIKATARTMFGAASLIVSLFGALQLTNVQLVANLVGLYNITLIITGILYLGLVTLCILVLSPIDLKGPIKEDWGELYKHFTGKSEVEILRSRLIAYIGAIEDNQEPIRRRRRLAIWAGIILAIIVIMMLSLSAIPREVIP
jgi:hypothetical protein